MTLICAVRPDVLAIHITEGHVETGSSEPYHQQPGDVIEEVPGYQQWLRRNGAYLGTLCGPERNILYASERPVMAPLDTQAADRVESFLIQSAGEATARPPLRVARKSKPADLARTGPSTFIPVQVHVLYLFLTQPLHEGQTCRISFPGLGWSNVGYLHDTRNQRSAAVHVSQLGFRPDDPLKVAFLSCWCGPAGGLDYGDCLAFQVVRDDDGHEVLTGVARLARGSSDAEDGLGLNYNFANVYEMDLSPLKTPGSYRVSVAGVGCSYPFTIADTVWRDSFYHSARSFYHQRSGLALTDPYTTFHRPRGFHPDDGRRIVTSTATLMDSGNGLNRQDTNFGNLVRGMTTTTLTGVWGGYFDAGDWDRRIQHLSAARYLLDLLELFPDFFAALSLNIPESHVPGADVLHEALYNLDGYRRMQCADGGIRGGIESMEHPIHGEASWNDSLTAIAYAPDPWSSYQYVATAAAAARLLQPWDAARSTVYATSARRAMDWAEATRNAPEHEPYRVQIENFRQFAAAELYRLTADPRWQSLLLASFRDATAAGGTLSSDACWSFARANVPGADTQIQATCRQQLFAEADELLAAGAQTAYGWIKPARNLAQHGTFAAPVHAIGLVRAHVLSGDARYLSGLIRACQCGAGANPANLCFTTGLGHEAVQHPLHIDSRITGRAPPKGITVFGPCDIRSPQILWGRWAHDLLKPMCHPPTPEWPPIESYWDVYWHPPICEFTVQSSLAQNAFVWGYLAARGH